MPGKITLSFGAESKMEFDWDKGEWVSDDQRIKSLVNVANMYSSLPFYEYSPSHGAYGFRLAKLVQKKLGGELSFPEAANVGEPEEGLVF